VERNKGKEAPQSQYTELVRNSEDQKVFTPLNLRVAAAGTSAISITSDRGFPPRSSVFKSGGFAGSSASSVKSSCSSLRSEKRKSALEQIKAEQERINRKKFRKDFWLLQVSAPIVSGKHNVCCKLMSYRVTAHVEDFFSYVLCVLHRGLW